MPEARDDSRPPATKTVRPLGAADQLTFLLSLVPYLLDRDGVSVAEAAAHFGASAQQVRDAVALIAVSGVPGETSQYLHGDLFDIQWDELETNDRIVLTHQVAIDDSPRLSAREAAALIAGLQYLSALPNNADTDAIASLMAKLTTGASGTPTQVAVAVGDSDQTVTIVQSAVQQSVQLEFDYLNSRGEQEHRLVDPLRIESVDRDWYLRGWCHLRQAVRTFRLDRMSDPTATTQPTSEHGGAAMLPDTLFQSSADDLTVVLELPGSALSLLADYRPTQVRPVGTGDRVQATLRVAHPHALKRLVTGLAGVVTVIAPGDVRAVVSEWAADGAARYDDPLLAEKE